MRIDWVRRLNAKKYPHALFFAGVIVGVHMAPSADPSPPPLDSPFATPGVFLPKTRAQFLPRGGTIGVYLPKTTTRIGGN